MYLPLRSAWEFGFSSRAKKQKKAGEHRLTWNDSTLDLRCFGRDGVVAASVLWQLVCRGDLTRWVFAGGGGCLLVSREAAPGPRGKALNFCQAQITTPFFTPWFFNWENHCAPQSYELYAHAMSQLGRRPDRIHCLFFRLFDRLVTILVVYNCSDLFQDCIGRTTSQM